MNKDKGLRSYRNCLEVSGDKRSVDLFLGKFAGVHAMIDGGRHYECSPETSKALSVDHKWQTYRQEGSVCTFVDHTVIGKGYSFLNFIPLSLEDFLGDYEGWQRTHLGFVIARKEPDLRPDGTYVYDIVDISAQADKAVDMETSQGRWAKELIDFTSLGGIPDEALKRVSAMYPDLTYTLYSRVKEDSEDQAVCHIYIDGQEAT